MYQMVLKQKPSDVALSAIAANNSAVINGAQNIFDSRRKLKMTRTTVEENDAKFTTRQKQALAVNQCLFLGATSQVEMNLCLFSFKKDIICYLQSLIDRLNSAERLSKN